MPDQTMTDVEFPPPGYRLCRHLSAGVTVDEVEAVVVGRCSDCGTSVALPEGGVLIPTLVKMDTPDALKAEVERLKRWKAEASEVMAGLQDLGRALGVPLGTRITGQNATERAQELVVENQRLRDTIQAAKVEAFETAFRALRSSGHASGAIYVIETLLNEARAALGVSGE